MENIKIKGSLKLDGYKKGKLVWSDESHNLVVNSGINAILSAISGIANNHISKVQLGINATPAKSTDVSISSPIDLTIISQTIVNQSLVIKFNIGEMDANNVIVSEFGLITQGNKLFSRRVVTPFPKSRDLTVEGIWTINIQNNE